MYERAAIKTHVIIQHLEKFLDEKRKGKKINV